MPQSQSGGPAAQPSRTTTGSPSQDSSGSQPKPLPGEASAADTDPIAMLSADHRHVEKLFADFEKAKTPQEKSQLAKQVCRELIVHTLLEEEIFYAACQGRVEKRLLDEAQVEHDGAKALIIEIENGLPEDEYFDAKVKVLSEDIKHHVREEEKPGEGIFARAKETGVAIPALAERLADRKRELMEQAQADALGPPQTRSFRVPMKAGRTTTSKEQEMARGSSATMDRERDERGRFVSDDDDRDYRRRPASRSRYDDDDDRRYARPRDDEGRFTSSRSRYDDDDDYRRGGREHGGWFGDSRGHSEASREGWRRSEHEGSGWRGDPEGHSRASREGWRHSEHEGSGWYGDPEGHSRASREGWRHSEHEGSGWRGDPEGHSRASREGWDERDRGGYRSRSRYDEDDDDRRYSRARDDEGRFTSTRSRSRYDDDEDDRGGGRGHGGWYGDSEGLAEAARQRRR